MPHLSIDDKTQLYYESDNFVEPWRKPEVILLVHGIGGCTEEWFAWIPPLAGKYQVVRVDLRGWGKSTVPPEGYFWSMDNYAKDLKAFIDKGGFGKVHLVGTKLGGRIALHFARLFPESLLSMTLICTPMTIRVNPNDSRDNRPTTQRGKAGVESWARATMLERLGPVPPEMMEWWIDLYSQSSPHVISEVFDLAWWTDEYELLPHIKIPTLVIDSSAIIDIEETRKWQRLIQDSVLVDIPLTTEGRQISASKPKECVAALLQFLERDKSRRTKAL